MSSQVLYRDCVLPEHYLTLADDIDNFEVRDSDVWVVTHPKAGTTWMQEISWCIGNDLNFKKAGSSMGSRFPYLEKSMFAHLLKDKSVMGLNNCAALNDLDQLPSPRFIKTHLPWQLLPKRIRDTAKRPKIIYVSRNPKDTCVSYYHHYLALNDYEGSCDDFCKIFMENNLVYSPFWNHVLDFWKRKDEPNILFVTYEDMIKDVRSVIPKVADFLGTPLSVEQISVLAEHVSFSTMKTNRSVNLVVKSKSGQSVDFVRKGIVGSWREEMSEDIAREFDAWSRTYLQDTDYTFQD